MRNMPNILRYNKYEKTTTFCSLVEYNENTDVVTMLANRLPAFKNVEVAVRIHIITKYVKFFDSDLMLNFQNVWTMLWSSSVVTVDVTDYCPHYIQILHDLCTIMY